MAYELIPSYNLVVFHYLFHPGKDTLKLRMCFIAQILTFSPLSIEAHAERSQHVSALIQPCVGAKPEI